MFLVEAQKVSRYVVGPLVLLWLLCQSMVLCAGLLNSSFLNSDNPGSTGTSTMNTMVDGAYSHSNHAHSAPQDTNMQSHNHSQSSDMVNSGIVNNDMAASDCCDEQESYLSNSVYSSIAFLLFFPVYWLILSLGQRLKHSIFHREPPPRYNYPRNHLVNCTFLN